MAFSEPIALKFGTYTLACHHFAARLPALGTATLNDTRVSVDSVSSIFDQALKDFFEKASPTDPLDAASQLCGLLRGQFNLFRNKSPRAARVLDDLTACIDADATTWDYQADIREAHLLGCEIARSFFASSPYSMTQQRCQRTCELDLEYKGALGDQEDQSLEGTLAFGYRSAPAAYRPESDDVVVYFTYDCNLALYLAYPFLFLHEYTGHVFATDYGNYRFNDGWMLHAADIFLHRKWKEDNSLVANLSPQSITVFRDSLIQAVGQSDSLVRRGLRFAQHFEAWVPSEQWFNAITYELAAFEPGPVYRKAWPTDFLNRLEQEFDQNRSALRDKLHASSTPSELYSQLALA